MNVEIKLPPKTGDTVKHRPSGETWVVAAVELYSNQLIPCGWPMGYAKIDDCEVVERCSEEEHVALLKELVELRNHRDGSSDPRASHALHQLVEMKVPGYVLPCRYCGNQKGAGRHDGEWCCAVVELCATQVALGKIRQAIVDQAGVCVGLLPVFDQILDEAGVGLCTGR